MWKRWMPNLIFKSWMDSTNADIVIKEMNILHTRQAMTEPIFMHDLWQKLGKQDIPMYYLEESDITSRISDQFLQFENWIWPIFWNQVLWIQIVLSLSYATAVEVNCWYHSNKYFQDLSANSARKYWEKEKPYRCDLSQKSFTQP